MINLDDIVVKIKTDQSEFKTDAAGKQLDQLESKGRSTAKGIGAVEQALGSSNGALNNYFGGLNKVMGAVDGLSRSQINVIRSIEDDIVKTKLSGQALAEYTALRKAGTAAESEAGIIIRGLVAAQYSAIPPMNTWRNLWGLLPASIGGANTAMNASALAARGVAAEHEAASASTRIFRETTHTLEPVLNAAGASVGAFGGFVSASRAGVTGLAVAITGSLIIALAKAGDEATTAQKRLGDLVGNKQTGSDLFAGLEGSAKRLGVGVGTLTGPMETVLKLMQDQNRIAGIVYAPGANSAANFAGGVKTLQDGLESLGAFLRSDISDSSRLGTVLSTTLGSFAETGFLTKKTFDALRDASPATANAIARAFNSTSAADFAVKVDGLRINVGQFLQAMARLGPEARASLATAESSAGTTGLALDQAGQAAGRLWKSLTVDPGVKSGLAGITTAIDYLAEHADVAKAVIIAIGGGLLLAFGGPVIAAIGAVGLAAIVFADKLRGIWDWINNLISKWNEWLAVGSKSPQNGGGPSLGGSLAQQAASGESSTGSFLFGPGSILGSMGSAIINSPYLGGSGSTAAQNDYWRNLEFGAPGEGFALGTDRIIPPGFPGDSARVSMNLTSGERLIVVPNNKTLGQHLGGSNPIHLGSFASGADMTVGNNVDAMLTPQGGALAAMASKFSTTFDDLGISLKDVKETISAAGNNKLNDVIRQSTIQIIGAIAITRSAVVSAISSASSIIAGAIGALASNVASYAQASSAAASAASSAAAGAGGTVSSATGGGVSGISRGGAGDLTGFHVSSAPTAADLADYDRRVALQQQASAADLARRLALSSAQNNIAKSTGGSKTVYGDLTDPNAGIPISASLDPNAGIPISQSDDPNAGIPYSTGSGEYWFAQPGEFKVPSKYKNDSFRAMIHASGDETISVKRYPTDQGGSSGGQSGNGSGITIGTVNIYNPEDGPSVIRTLSQLREKNSRDVSAALKHR